MVDNLSSVYGSPIRMMGQKLNIQFSSVECYIDVIRWISAKNRAKGFQILIIYSENIKLGLAGVYTGSADATWHFMGPIILKLQFSIWNIFASYAPLRLNAEKYFANLIQLEG